MALLAPFFAVIAATSPVEAQEVAATTPFSQDVVKRLAADLASKSYVAPKELLPKGAENLDYDQFRQLRVRPERTIWRGEGLKFELQVLPNGWLFKEPVGINIVEGETARQLAPDTGYFDIGTLAGKLPAESRFAFSGLRVLGPINRPDLFDEIIVFQGASYFRAVSRGQTYGLSARGLAINVGKEGGEEFPSFRQFWIEKPAPSAAHIVVHALLDSPSVAGAYRFVILPGVSTSIDVEATLYPRQDLTDYGLAPLTSMFLFSGINRSRVSDFRPAVHDSDGLAISNGWEEQIWRPLNNSRRLEVSEFLDVNPKGFGLIQRSRTFSHFQDLEAQYERRPSGWVEPRGAWGPGAVRLFEIPSEEEIHDNVVAYWKPEGKLTAGRPQTFGYKLSWPDDAPRTAPTGVIVATRAGLVNGPQRKSGMIQFAVDIKGKFQTASGELPVARVEAKPGAVTPAVVQTNPEIGGLRVAFGLDPKASASSEIRLTLHIKDKPVSETWLYRWTKE